MKKDIEKLQAECRSINKRLPSKALKEIEETTGIPYMFVYRTMNGDFKLKFDERHERVLNAARDILAR